MTREQTTPDAPKRVLDVPVPRGDRVRDDAGQRLCAVAGDAARVQGWTGHVGAGSGDAAGAEGVAAQHRPLRVKPWVPPAEQMCRIGRHSWSVARLFELVRGLPIMQVPLAHLNVYQTYEKLTLREMVMHMAAVQAADLSAPIILDEDGELMDGRHRIMKAMLTGQATIRAVRFDENPSPCRVSD